MSRTSKLKKPIMRMSRNQLSSLIINEKLSTTLPKARALKAEAEALLSVLTQEIDGFNLERKVAKILYGNAVKKAIEEKSKFKSISVYRTGKRLGDSAQMALIVINLNENTPKINKEKVK